MKGLQNEYYQNEYYQNEYKFFSVSSSQWLIERKYMVKCDFAGLSFGPGTIQCIL